MALIEVNGVSKTFRLNAGRKLLRDRFLDLFRPHQETALFQALRDISFTVKEGESVGIIGENGAGKSTVLSLITGLAKPNKGTIRVSGRIAALLELGSGFHPDLTGEENVYVNAALLGFSEREAKARYPSIVEFSELGEFIKEPLRAYSSGMLLRLAFSVAVHVDPAILIIDEVIGVGDAHFQAKCMDKIAALRQQGVTFLCVSHGAKFVETFCDRAIWLHRGELIWDGKAPLVTKEYAAFVQNPSLGLPNKESLLSAAR